MKNFILVFCLLFAYAATAQKPNVKKLVKAGEEYNKAGEFAKAAEAYASAYDVKKDKEKLAYEAGYAYFRSRNYDKALKYFRPISKESEQWPLAGFFYGKCLKAIGMYDQAAIAFRGFRRKYPGASTDQVLEMADMEIKGCDLASELASIPNDKSIFSLSLNTNFNEFAPVPFSEDILYFSTDVNGNTQLKRTQFTGGTWSDPVEPNLPKGPAGNTCNGAFSPDQSSFYFTVCLTGTAWDSRDASCEIYGTKRKNNTWTAPEKLRDYLKMDGNTATHPTVVHADGKEWLYFVSDRTGGQGGLDIWYTTREINSESFDFTFPENIGNVINTPGDEFSPFYDVESEKLFFSSNGFPNLGGFDIYSTRGKGMKWSEPIHQGIPLNSSADDYYYQKAPGGAIAFFTSNRSTDDWETTTDDNIFQLGLVSNPLAQIEGRVLNRDNMEPVPGASVMIRQVGANGSEILMTTQYTVEGGYQVPLMTGKNYKLEALAEGYAANAILVEAIDLNPNKTLTRDIYLHAQSLTDLAETETRTALEKNEEIFAQSWESTDEIKPGSMETAPIMAVTSGSMGNVANSTNASLPKIETGKSTYVDEFSLDDEIITDSWDALEAGNSTRNKEVGYETENRTTETSIPAIVKSNVSTNNYPIAKSSTRTSSSNNIPDKFNPTYADGGSYTTSRFKNDGVTTSAPKHKGSYYKIQISIEMDYDSFVPQLDKIDNLGRIDTEYIIEKGWIRVLLADYFSKDEALRVLYEVRDSGFPEAFLVRYQDGYRKI